MINKIRILNSSKQLFATVFCFIGFDFNTILLMHFIRS
jgi:hypothetical protein